MLCYIICKIVSDVGSSSDVFIFVMVCVLISYLIDGVSVYSIDVIENIVVFDINVCCWLYKFVSRLLLSSSVV